jgi:hypothetical protein
MVDYRDTDDLRERLADWTPGPDEVRSAVRDVAMTCLTPARFAAAVRASVGVVRGWTGNLPIWAEAPAGRILDAVEGKSADIGMGLSDLTLSAALALIDGPDRTRGHPPPGDPDSRLPGVATT